MDLLFAICLAVFQCKNKAGLRELKTLWWLLLQKLILTYFSFSTEYKKAELEVTEMHVVEANEADF